MRPLREIQLVGDEPQAIEHLVLVMLQQRPNPDRQQARDAIMETVEDLLAESENS